VHSGRPSAVRENRQLNAFAAGAATGSAVGNDTVSQQQPTVMFGANNNTQQPAQSVGQTLKEGFSILSKTGQLLFKIGKDLITKQGDPAYRNELRYLAGMLLTEVAPKALEFAYVMPPPFGIIFGFLGDSIGGLAKDLGESQLKEAKKMATEKGWAQGPIANLEEVLRLVKDTQEKPTKEGVHQVIERLNGVLKNVIEPEVFHKYELHPNKGPGEFLMIALTNKSRTANKAGLKQINQVIGFLRSAPMRLGGRLAPFMGKFVKVVTFPIVAMLMAIKALHFVVNLKAAREAYQKLIKHIV
jgi:hypothetical protein